MISGDSPCISVVVPTYQRAAFLPATLTTLLEQRCRPAYEVIVMDDGSTDATPAVMQDFAARGVCYLRSAHLGLPGIVNEGLRRAGGEYLLIANDHDFYHPDLLQTMHDALEAHPSAALAICDVELLDPDGQELLQRYEYPYKGPIAGATLLRDVLLPGLGTLAPANLIRRCALGGSLLDEALGPAADAELWLRLAARHDAVHVGRPLVRMRQRDEGSQLYLRNHEIVRRTLQLKRRYLREPDDEQLRARLERSWRRQVDRSAAVALWRVLTAGHPELRPEIVRFAREEATAAGAAAIRLLAALPPGLALRLLQLIRRAARAKGARP